MNLSISFSLCCHYPNLTQYHLYCSLTTGSPHFYYWTPYCLLDQRVRVIFLKFLELEPDPEITKFRSHSCNRCTGRVQKGGSSICFSPLDSCKKISDWMPYKQQTFISHGAGGWTSEMRVSAWLGEDSFLGAHFSWYPHMWKGDKFSLCCPFYKALTREVPLSRRRHLPKLPPTNTTFGG